MSTTEDIEALNSYHDDKVKIAEEKCRQTSDKISDINKKIEELQEIRADLRTESGKALSEYNDTFNAKGAFLRLVRDTNLKFVRDDKVGNSER